MSVTTVPPPGRKTLADLVEQIGSVPLERIPCPPAPGTATEADVLMRPGGEKRIYELVDGVLVEKPMGYYESILAGILIRLLGQLVEDHDLGQILGEAGTLRLAPGLVRVPDVAFISWRHFPDRMLPAEPIPDLAPDLAVEILSEGNTEPEMERKRREYFAAGVSLVWLVDSASRTARVYASPEAFTLLDENGVLDGGELLPGFSLRLGDWLDRAGQRKPR